MTRPNRETPAGRAYLDLQNKARREQRSTQTLQMIYTLERFLARIEISQYTEILVLKGGMLMAAWNARRATKDLDFLAQNLAHDEEAVLRMVTEIASLKPPLDDGVIFHPELATTKTIRDEATYPGVAVILPASIDRANIKVKIEVSIGDPVTPAPETLEFPVLREGFPPVKLLAYPMPVALAEKICTAVERGKANTRIRDFVDIWTLAGLHEFNCDDLTAALAATSAYRSVQLRPLRELLRGFAAERQDIYRTFRRNLGVEVLALPDDFSVLLDEVLTFTDPMMTAEVPGSARWDPQTRQWLLTAS